MTSSRANTDHALAAHRRWRGNIFLSGLGFVARTVCFAYLFVLMLLSFIENTLLFPAPHYPAGDWNPSGLDFEDVFFQSADGTELHGWYVEHPEPKGIILYCHGNGDHVGYLSVFLMKMHNQYQVSVFAFDYRGYGRSQGRPNEAGILADSQAAHQWLVERTGVEKSDLILMGRSLGGAVAIDLAAHHDARGLILERTFTSLPDVAASHYPWAPVKLMMRNRFNSLNKISAYRGPLLQSHGSEDEVIPFELGEKLFAASRSEPKTFHIEPGGTHNPPAGNEYQSKLKHFIDHLPPLR